MLAMFNVHHILTLASDDLVAVSFVVIFLAVLVVARAAQGWGE